ncbi:class IV adenylate cyclase [Conexibacter sp. DBS9H8]|uniref:class IV adenylate cyclase n=1 Tax=Conexibacter sp. DBS9H8 TaxID=2937801 RepID=UPI00200BBA3C|nr:class IV adenylate cyclase [Conexibacter sp. DBS9H8]
MTEDARTTPATRRNIELKARDEQRDHSLAVCRRIGAEDHGELWQRDTYFTVSHGGLKLREEIPGRPHLIQFERADGPQERESRYRIAPVADAETLTHSLGAALGMLGTVEKTRRLFLWQSVRIHLDAVVGLGDFIELEAVAPEVSDLTHERRLVAELREAFSITDDRLCATGYASQLGIDTRRDG